LSNENVARRQRPLLSYAVQKPLTSRAYDR
jgi:hypothetical protein